MTVDRFDPDVVIAVVNAADRRLDPGLGEAFGILDRGGLAATIAVVDRPPAMDWPPVVDRLLEGVDREAGIYLPSLSPANEIMGVDVDHDGDIHEPGHVAT